VWYEFEEHPFRLCTTLAVQRDVRSKKEKLLLLVLNMTYLVVKVHLVTKENLCSYCSGPMVFEILVGGSFEVHKVENENIQDYNFAFGSVLV
jgi:hypothetical protein